LIIVVVIQHPAEKMLYANSICNWYWCTTHYHGDKMVILSCHWKPHILFSSQNNSK